ncbi:YbfB/YjiJ family MFS transporter [Vreelandella neptunia]|uniref:YbfB/YjiJ family MFS transporter n=1 Tax=Vreelandella neptunia TaxID=115551 RepID=A0ABZ0YHY7_9GAMM|nr:YbfB/YjiJ family MFS transporter [Halomonas neptunia]MDN3561169.1 YbfB/YjiJ family MFS transporter [Halomonas neptunia]TDW00229.1 putative MFS family arabinose efflux permease [Halomonas alkaliantarctica]WQH11304.1 YbfB/YjiJ family MFS transporter [Halomonas neptunia]
MSQTDFFPERDYSAFKADLLTLAALALVPAIGLGIARFSYALLLPSMRAGLGWSYADAGWMTSVNAAGYLIAALLSARAIGFVGANRVMRVGVAACVIALIMMGVFRHTVLLNVSWFLAGFGGASAFVAGGVIAAQVSQRHPARASFLLGIFYAGPGLGIVLSGLGVPWVLGQWGAMAWSAAWLVLAAIAVVLALGVMRGIRVKLQRRDQEYTSAPLGSMGWMLVGYSFFGAGYITYMTFMIAWIQAHGESAAFQSLFWVALGLAVALFPWLWTGVLKNQRHGRAFAILNGVTLVGAVLPLISSAWPVLLASAAIFGCAFFAVVASTTAFVRRNCDASAWASGIGAMTVAFSIGQTLGPTLSGWLNDLTGGLSVGLLTSAVFLVAAALVGLLQTDSRATNAMSASP